MMAVEQHRNASRRKSCIPIDLTLHQVAARDAFGNRCSIPPLSTMRCKLVCSSSDGSPTFVEATTAAVVEPFVSNASLRANFDSPHSQIPSAQMVDNARARENFYGAQQQGVIPDINVAASPDVDACIEGEVDVGR
jgi:hypothetical protein